MSDEAKPPYVMFEVRPVENREASIEAGHTVFKDEVFAIVTPAGTRDRLEKNAEDWLKSLEEGVVQSRIPASWPEAFRHKLSLFQTNQESPVDGTPLANMTILSPAEVKNILNANVRSVEDLAAAPEEALNRIGMGARSLKQKAQAWLDSSNKQGKSSAELNALRVKVDEQSTQLSEALAKLATAAAQIQAFEKLSEKTSA